ANPRVGGEPSVDVRHERSGLFVAGEDEADRAVPKGVHQLQVLLAGNPKCETDPFVFEAGDEESRGLHASGMAHTPIYRMWKPRNGGPRRKRQRNRALALASASLDSVRRARALATAGASPRASCHQDCFARHRNMDTAAR